MKSFLAFVTTALGLSLGTAAFAAFADMDTDGDGALSADEFAAQYPDAAAEAFASVDLNADGMITEDELAAAVDAGLLPAE